MDEETEAPEAAASEQPNSWLVMELWAEDTSVDPQAVSLAPPPIPLRKWGPFPHDNAGLPPWTLGSE